MDLTFPSRDQGFGRVVATLSEASNAAPGANFVSNEDSYPRVAGELRRRSRPGEVYLGVGPEQNLTLIAHAAPAVAFVIDNRRRNLLVHLLYKALVGLAADRVGFLGKFTNRGPVGLTSGAEAGALMRAFTAGPMERPRLDATTAEVAELLRPLGVLAGTDLAELASLQARLSGPGLHARFLALPMYPTLARLVTATDREGGAAHFLASEALYQGVRALQLGDLVVPLVGDFAGPTALPALATWSRRHALRVGVFYVSDVEFFLLRGGRFGAYLENLGRLPWSEDGVLVRTSTREIAHPARIQGDSSTTVLEPAARFLARARRGAVRSPDDLFAV